MGLAYSCKKERITREKVPAAPDGHLQVIVRKCRCNHVWCPSCGTRAVRRGIFGMREWDWRRVRTLVTTVDPSKFPDGPERALNVMEKEKAAFIRELNRRGADIEAYRVFTEWHDNGFPHYHWFLYVRQQGKAGQIGEALLKEVWRYGSYVHESWIKSQSHWESWIGYAAKTGYMHKDGKRQGVLPDWLKEKTRRVRRISGSIDGAPKDRSDVAADDNFEEWLASFLPSKDQVKKPERTNGEILLSCGSTSNLMVVSKSGVAGEGMGLKIEDYGEFSLNYQGLVGQAKTYVEGLGWLLTMRVIVFLELYKDYCLRREGRATRERATKREDRFTSKEVKAFRKYCVEVK